MPIPDQPPSVRTHGDAGAAAPPAPLVRAALLGSRDLLRAGIGATLTEDDPRAAELVARARVALAALEAALERAPDVAARSAPVRRLALAPVDQA